MISRVDEAIISLEIANLNDQLNPEQKEILQKGRAAVVGEVREWSGKKYKKTSSGWESVKSEGIDKKPSKTNTHYIGEIGKIKGLGDIKQEDISLGDWSNRKVVNKLKKKSDEELEDIKTYCEKESKKAEEDGDALFEKNKEKAIPDYEEKRDVLIELRLSYNAIARDASKVIKQRKDGGEANKQRYRDNYRDKNSF